jgi:hypothetical protein
MKAANKPPQKKWNPNAKQQQLQQNSPASAPNPASKSQKKSPPQLSRITEIQSDGSQSSSELDSMDSGRDDDDNDARSNGSASSASSQEEDKHFLEEMKRMKSMQLQPPKKQQQPPKTNQMTAIMMMNHNANSSSKPKGNASHNTQNKAAEDANDIVYKALMDHKNAEMQRMTTLASDTRTITEAMLRKQVSLLLL